MNRPLRSVEASRDAVAAGELGARELVEASVSEIERLDPALHAFLRIDRVGALRRADRVDAARARGEKLPPLAGVPVAVKDNLATRGLETSCASRILDGFVPSYDATVVERLRDAGAIMVGKTNLDEFGMGASTEYSAWGATRNPWDPGRVPGGSSGGSAAAVTAGMVPAALGSDTGGSVRQPASFCGVVGVKPTWGRLSRWGLTAFASSLDAVGVLVNGVRDAALLLGVMAGHDPRDSTSAARDVPDYLAGIEEPRRPLAVGVPREYLEAGLDGEVRALFEACLARWEAEGASLIETSLPSTPHAVACYHVVASAEASANLARYDGIRFGAPPAGGAGLVRCTRGRGLGPEVKRRILLGTYALSRGYYDAWLLRAQRARATVAAEFSRAFEACDLLATPATPTAAFRLGEKSADPLAMYLSDVYTAPASLAGLPAMAIPAGRTRAGLPAGLQLIAPPFQEALMLRAARELERILALDLVPPGASGEGAA